MANIKRISNFIESLPENEKREDMDAVVLSTGGGLEYLRNNGGDCNNADNCYNTRNDGDCTNGGTCLFSYNGGTCTNGIISPENPTNQKNCASDVQAC